MLVFRATQRHYSSLGPKVVDRQLGNLVVIACANTENPAIAWGHYVQVGIVLTMPVLPDAGHPSHPT